MKRGQRYMVLVAAAVALLVLIITSSVVVSKRKDMESESYYSSRGTMEPSISQVITPTPTDAPSLRPSIRPEQNWTYPSQEPTIEANGTDSFFPTNFTASPAPTDNSTGWPSFSPSLHPNSTMIPSMSPVPTYWNDSLPSEQPTSSFPSILPTATVTPSALDIQNSTRPPLAGTTTTRPNAVPTPPPTSSGSQGASRVTTSSVPESDQDSLWTLGTRFYAIGDVPYTKAEETELKIQIENIPEDAEFVIHVGDIRSARAGNPCTLEEYQHVAAILNQSHAPIFIVLGDNEWNDCPNVDQGFTYWKTVFGRFDEQWNHAFSLQRHQTRTENFAFVHKRTLFFGLNLVGGHVQRAKEWKERLTDLYEWVQQLVDSRVLSPQADADSVVIFGHADPSHDHDDFFDPLVDYLEQDLVSTIPFLYLNGDGHAWNYKEKFYRRPNFLRIQVEGGTRDPPLQISLNNSDARAKPISDVFNYNRMLTIIEI